MLGKLILNYTLLSVAEQTGLSFARSQTRKTGFL